MYNIDKLTASNALAKATGCNKKVLQKMIQKGQGAYFSSGSRPNQTAHSWGRARMASGITGGKAAGGIMPLFTSNIAYPIYLNEYLLAVDAVEFASERKHCE